ncbi:hypothetical protein H8L32_23760 [Undibacterium sp. CY18W]|uniref:Uncharacterized protein n=1 Tax=Undibacterium hunanense TaxID=2762292 RepID=A0ABR6ZXC1_9BURK|nr:hypothetical protein [Undibacterium hunanense]MBC3920501.1 hypothetical protein [Undibacterium hunanense]
MNTVFAAPVFDSTVIFEGNELFKGRSAAENWAKKLGAELECVTTVQKTGTGWVICGNVDGEDCIWAVFGQRLKRINRE